MAKDLYRIEVSYDTADYEWASLDEAAGKIAGVEEAGGGTGGGIRDLSYYYPTLKRAENALARFRKDGRFLVGGDPTSLLDDLW